MKVPFPNIDKGLAVKPHMYVCIQDGDKKRFLSCQTKKPILLVEENPPFVYIDENNDINRNPFKWPTLIGCDYAFGINHIHIDSNLLAKKRRDVCQELYDEIEITIQHPSFYTEIMNSANLLKLNDKMTNKSAEKFIKKV